MDKIKIYQLQNGYAYNSDTLFLYDFFTKCVKNDEIFKKNLNEKNLLDIGANTGVLALLAFRDLSKMGVKIHAIEIEKRAFFLLEKNFLCVKMKHKFCYENNAPELVNDDFLSHDFGEKKFSVIISNPPFYSTNRLISEKKELFLAHSERAMPFAKVLQKVTQILHKHGIFVFCFDAREISKVTNEILHANLFLQRIKFIHGNVQKSAKTALFCVGFTKKQLEICPPLFANEVPSDNDKVLQKVTPTAEAQKIYKKSALFSLKISP